MMARELQVLGRLQMLLLPLELAEKPAQWADAIRDVTNQRPTAEKRPSPAS